MYKIWAYNNYNLLNLFHIPPSFRFLLLLFLWQWLQATIWCPLSIQRLFHCLVVSHLNLSLDSGLGNKSTFFNLKSIDSCWVNGAYNLIPPFCPPLPSPLPSTWLNMSIINALGVHEFWEAMPINPEHLKHKDGSIVAELQQEWLALEKNGDDWHWRVSLLAWVSPSRDYWLC